MFFLASLALKCCVYAHLAVQSDLGAVFVTVQLEVWSDFVCPYCFYAASALNLLEETHDVAVEWHSFELRPAGTVIPDWYLERIQQSRPRIHEMMWDHFSIQLNIGPFGISTRKALIGAKVAAAQGEAIAEA